MAKLTMKVPVGPLSCPFADCRPTLEVEVTGRLISPNDARSQDGRGFIRLGPAPEAFRNAATQHLLDAHSDGIVELSDGTERRVAELSSDEWNDLFSGPDDETDR